MYDISLISVSYGFRKIQENNMTFGSLKNSSHSVNPNAQALLNIANAFSDPAPENGSLMPVLRCSSTNTRSSTVPLDAATPATTTGQYMLCMRTDDPTAAFNALKSWARYVCFRSWHDLLT